MKQFRIIKAYKALIKLGQQDLPIKLAFDLFKIKQALQPQWDFQVDEENKLTASAKVNHDGTVSFDSPEAADAFRQKLKDLSDIDVDLKITPARIPLSIPGLTLSMDDIDALDCFVQFTTNQKGGN